MKKATLVGMILLTFFTLTACSTKSQSKSRTHKSTKTELQSTSKSSTVKSTKVPTKPKASSLQSKSAPSASSSSSTNTEPAPVPLSTSYSASSSQSSSSSTTTYSSTTSISSPRSENEDDYRASHSVPHIVSNGYVFVDSTTGQYYSEIKDGLELSSTYLYMTKKEADDKGYRKASVNTEYKIYDPEKSEIPIPQSSAMSSTKSSIEFYTPSTTKN